MVVDLFLPRPFGLLRRVNYHTCSRARNAKRFDDSTVKLRIHAPPVLELLNPRMASLRHAEGRELIEEQGQANWQDLTSSAAAEEFWDVVIVGAGPAGSTAAIHLASHGHKVLLVDKETFPRDKICGDGLIADTINSLKRVGLYETVRQIGHKATVSSVYSPSRIHFDIPGEFLTLKRFLLDELIARKAVASGARFCQAKVTNIEAHADDSLRISVAGSDKPLTTRVALLATGANVEMPARLGLVTNNGPSAVALRCYVRSPVELDRLIVSYDRSITPGYAWIFPLGNGEFNVGCGMTYKRSTAPDVNLRDVFRLFITTFPLADEIMKRAETVTPLRGAMLRCGLRGTYPVGPGNTLVLGESIGTTFPFTGEGIGKAMETGELAAKVVHEAIAGADLKRLHQFPERIERELKPKFLGYQIAENWFSKPWLNDFVARRIRASRILQELVEGIVNETVDPREVFSLRGILRSFVS
jgi:geranylgeranyl reductase family protein